MKQHGVYFLILLVLFLIAPWPFILLAMIAVPIIFCYLFYGKLMGAKRWWIPIALYGAAGVVILIVSVVGAVLNWIF